MVQKLNLLEREQIFQLLSQHEPPSIIALRLNRHISTIYRELNRLPKGAYSPSAAQEQASSKAKNSRKHKKLQSEELRKYVREKLYQYWSPEQISERLLIDYPDNSLMRISPETIYRFIYNLEDPEEKEQVIKLLRQRKKRRHSRKGKKGKRTSIPNLISIWERPKESEDREELGHWEGDLIIGKNGKTAIGTLVERTLRLTLIVPLFKNKYSVTTVVGFAKAFEKLPA